MSTAATTKRPLKDDLRELFRMPRELWLVLFSKFAEYLALYSLADVLTLWLSNDLGMNDVQAGWWFGTFWAVISLFALLTGFSGDSIGFRRALIASFACSATARALVSFSHSRAVALFGLMLLAFGVAGATPSMNAAVRRYTNSRTRSFGFALYYLSINIGGFFAGRMVEIARRAFRDPTNDAQIFRTFHLPVVGETRLSAYGTIFLLGFCCSVVAFVVSLFLREKAEAPPVAEEASTPVEQRASKAPWSIAWELMREKPFWRFMLFIALLALVKLIFTHYHATFPKYGLRVFGERFPLGDFMAFNPILTIFLVPVVTTLTRHRSAFNCIVFGSFVCTAGMFLFCLPSWTTNPPGFLPDFVRSIVAYPTPMIAIAVFSVGEAFWSPRILEYTAVIAPRGRESSYMGLSSLPYFFAKMIAGPMSGYLLAWYCPAVGPKHPAILWGIIGATTLLGPISIVLLRSAIEGRKKSSDKEAARVDAPAAA